jgi:hypothetical protein
MENIIKDPDIKTLSYGNILFDLFWFFIIYAALYIDINPLILLIKISIIFLFVLSLILVPANYLTFRGLKYRRYDGKLTIIRIPYWYSIISITSKIFLFWFLGGGIVYTIMWLVSAGITQANYRHVLDMHDRWYTDRHNRLYKLFSYIIKGDKNK